MAASIKAQNIDVSQARIKDAQITSLTADKLTAGTINAEEIEIKDASGNGEMDMSKQALKFFEGENLRIYMGRDDEGNYIFLVQNADESQGIYMNDDGNIIITGLFSTGKAGQARTVIDENGIQSYDENGQRYGLWCNEPNSADMRYADLKLYCNGKEVFKIYNGIDHTSMYLNGKQILLGGNSITMGQGNWKFQQGASGHFQTADEKTVTVSGGLITDIS